MFEKWERFLKPWSVQHAWGEHDLGGIENLLSHIGEIYNVKPEKYIF